MSVSQPNLDNFAVGRRVTTAWNADGPRGMVTGDLIKLIETGAATTTGKIFVPDNSVLMSVGAQAEALWDDGTSASLVAGLYDNAGSEIDANGFFEAVNLKATDLIISGGNQSVSVEGGTDFMGGEAGALVQAGSNTHWLYRVLPTGGEIRFVVTAGGENGSAGITWCWATWFTQAGSPRVYSS